MQQSKLQNEKGGMYVIVFPDYPHVEGIYLKLCTLELRFSSSATLIN